MLLGNRSVTCFKIRSKELSNNKKEEGTTSVKGKFLVVVNRVKLIFKLKSIQRLLSPLHPILDILKLFVLTDNSPSTEAQTQPSIACPTHSTWRRD